VSERVEILLVEDSPADAELTLRSLKANHPANRVVVVRDGAEALDFIFRRAAFAGRDDGPPKVILLDLHLPKVDGLEVLRQIKADPATQSIPVVVLTSSAEERDINDSYKLGVNSYVVKPVGFAEFAQVVSHLGLYWLVVNRPPVS
jgi:CheY-like chemotaxis protein